MKWLMYLTSFNIYSLLDCIHMAKSPIYAGIAKGISTAVDRPILYVGRQA